MKMKTYEAIKQEREYQDERFNEPENQISEFLLIMERCLDKAKTRWGTEGAQGALDEIRQVTAVGVACMDQHGAVLRQTVPA